MKIQAKHCESKQKEQVNGREDERKDREADYVPPWKSYIASMIITARKKR